MPERRAGVEKAGFGRLVCFWRLKLAVGGLCFFPKLAGRFFNGAEAELRRDGVAVFVGPCAFCLFFVWCAPAFYFGFGNFCLELTKGGYFFMMFL